MGKVVSEIEFDYPAPSLEVVIEQLEELTGLQIIIVKRYSEDYCDSMVDIAFADFPESYFQIEAEEPDKSNDTFIQEMKAEYHGYEILSHKEKDPKQFKKQIVSIVGGHSQEPTLFDATRLTLLKLGGIQSRAEYYRDAEKFDFPITKEQLELNHFRHKKEISKLKWKIIAWIPIMIPVYIVSGIIGLIKMPFEMRHTYKKVKSVHPEFFEEKRE